MAAHTSSDRTATELRRLVERSWGDADELSLVIVQLRKRRSALSETHFLRMVEARILELTGSPTGRARTRSGGGTRSSRSASSKGSSAKARSAKTSTAAAKATKLEADQKKLKLELQRAKAKIKKLTETLAETDEELEEAEAEIEDLQAQLSSRSKAKPNGKLYQQLGLHPDCEDWVFAAVKKAFVTRFHPDANHGAAAAERRQLERRFAAIYPVFEELTKKRSRRKR